MIKKVLVVGASENPSRYSNKAIIKLCENSHKVFAFGNRPGEVMGIDNFNKIPVSQNWYNNYLYECKKSETVLWRDYSIKSY